MSELAPEPVEGPDGEAYVVRVYRAGTMQRFPSAGYASRPGGALLLPLIVMGWLLHLIVFRGRWTVAVTPWHNLPGPRYRERAVSKSQAVDRSVALEKLIRAGAWKPGAGHAGA